MFFKYWPYPASFLFFVFSNKHYNVYNKYKSLQFVVLGFKPTTLLESPLR